MAQVADYFGDQSVLANHADLLAKDIMAAFTSDDPPQAAPPATTGKLAGLDNAMASLPQHLQVLVASKLSPHRRLSYLLEHLPMWLHMALLRAACAESGGGLQLDLPDTDAKFVAGAVAGPAKLSSKAVHAMLLPLSRMRNITAVSLADQRLAGNDMCGMLMALQSATALLSLDLSGNHVDGASMQQLAASLACWTALQVLDLCFLSGHAVPAADDVLAALPALPLQRLHVANLPSTTALQALARLSKLAVLSLRATDCDSLHCSARLDEALGQMCGLTQLQHLAVSQIKPLCQPGDTAAVSGLAALSGLTHLAIMLPALQFKQVPFAALPRLRSLRWEPDGVGQEDEDDAGHEGPAATFAQLTALRELTALDMSIEFGAQYAFRYADPNSAAGTIVAQMSHALSQLTSLQDLRLGGGWACQRKSVAEALGRAVGRLTGLTRLDSSVLHGAAVALSARPDAAPLPQLQHLQLTVRYMRAAADSSLDWLTAWLRQLPCLEHLRLLKDLYFEDTEDDPQQPFSDLPAFTETLLQLARLTHLELSWLKLDADQDLLTLANLPPALQQLKLTGCHVPYRSPLGQRGSLKHLLLVQCTVSSIQHDRFDAQAWEMLLNDPWSSVETLLVEGGQACLPAHVIDELLPQMQVRYGNMWRLRVAALSVSQRESAARLQRASESVRITTRGMCAAAVL